MKMYHRMSRFAYLRWFNHYDRELFKWLLSLKPGDTIGACTAFNHTVASVKPQYRRFRARGWYIDEVLVIDTEGRYHWAPGGGCVCRPYSREAILADARMYASADAWSPEDRAFWQAILDAETTTTPHLSPQGIYIGPKRA